MRKRNQVLTLKKTFKILGSGILVPTKLLDPTTTVGSIFSDPSNIVKQSRSGTHTTHLSCWPHIVLFFDNRFSYIMNPIHIKGWTRDRLAWLQAPQNGPKPHGRTNSSLFFPLLSSTLLFVIPQKISSVRGWTCVADHMHIKRILQWSPNMLRGSVRFTMARKP